jgi:hypothetical protein
LLDGISHVANGQPAKTIYCSDLSTSATASNTSAESSISNSGAASRATCPTGDDIMKSDEKKKKTSPAVAMAEASLLSQKAAMQEAENFKAMLEFQKGELFLRKEDSKLVREERVLERQLNFEERNNTAKMLQKMVERLCPEEDPTDRYAARKRKLDELRSVLGEELYGIKLEQLKDEFKKWQQCNCFYDFLRSMSYLGF